MCLPETLPTHPASVSAYPANFLVSAPSLHRHTSLCSPSCPSHDLPAVTLPRPAWRLTVRSSVGVSQTLLAKRPVSPPFEATWVKLLDLQVESRTCRSRLSPYLPRSYQGSLKQSGVRYATQAPQLPPDARERHKPSSKGAVLEPKWLRHSLHPGLWSPWPRPQYAGSAWVWNCSMSRKKQPIPPHSSKRRPRQWFSKTSFC